MGLSPRCSRASGPLRGLSQSRWKARAAVWLLAPLAAGAAWALARALPLREGVEHSICLFRRGTGIPCPGCGLTRACVHLARGEWSAALADHPFALLLAGEAVLAWLAAGAVLVLSLRRRALPLLGASAAERSPRWLNLWLVAHVVGLGALWLGRLATGSLPW